MYLTDVDAAAMKLDQENLLYRILQRIRLSLELQDILTATVAEVRSFLGVDRVKIYEFHTDGSGQVVAEAIHEHRLPSLLGLNFPTDDIPPYARELFIKARMRSVVDVESHRIGHSLMTHSDIAQWRFDTIQYRPIDPCHAEYLTAMGVRSSVVVPIFVSDRLWGLLVAHHSTSRAIPDSELCSLQMVVDQLSVAIAQAALLKQAREKAEQESTINRIATLLHSLSKIELQAALEETIAAFRGSGGRLYITPAEFDPDHSPLKPATVPLSQDVPHLGKLYTAGKQPVL
jgi:hypothetical protein